MVFLEEMWVLGGYDIFEDDVLITKNGCEVLSAGVPKQPEQIEALMAANGA